MDERVNPIKITINRTGETYELDFCREAVYMLDRDGFKIDEVTDYLSTNVPKLFYYAFRKNHRKISRTQTDKILREELHGLTPAMLERLTMLYMQAAMDENIQDEEDLVKNESVTVEM